MIRRNPDAVCAFGYFGLVVRFRWPVRTFWGNLLPINDPGIAARHHQ
jgi:hypothetical protein